MVGSNARNAMKMTLDLILIVDSHEKNSRGYKNIMLASRRVGRVVEKTSGREALEFLEELKRMQGKLPDMVFVSTSLPDMQCWDFLDTYQKNFGELRDNSIVMLTATSDVKNLIKSAVHPEVQDFLIHPIMDSEVERVMNDFAYHQRYQLHSIQRQAG